MRKLILLTLISLLCGCVYYPYTEHIPVYQYEKHKWYYKEITSKHYHSINVMCDCNDNCYEIKRPRKARKVYYE